MQNVLFSRKDWVTFPSAEGQVCLPLPEGTRCIQTSFTMCQVGYRNNYPIFLDCQYDVAAAKQLIETGSVPVITATPNASQQSAAERTPVAAIVVSSVSNGQGGLPASNSASLAIAQANDISYTYALPLWAQVTLNIIVFGTLIAAAIWFYRGRQSTQPSFRVAYASQRRQPKIQFEEV